jgi:hypothetical protein
MAVDEKFQGKKKIKLIQNPSLFSTVSHFKKARRLNEV